MLRQMDDTVRFWRPLLILVLVVGIAACTPRLSAERAAPLPGAQIETVFVAAARSLDQSGSVFGQARPEQLNFFQASVSIPPGRQIGQIAWQDGPVDPATDFAVTETQVHAGLRHFADRVRQNRPQSETLVFIHGYNNTLSEALYRLVQIQTDFNPGVPSVLFSWPSAGDPRGYIYDRDSVLFARNDLEAVLTELTSRPGDRLLLMAHSMGSQLVMETLRQAALTGNRQVLDRLNGVILMSPDIDPDLFRRQAETIGQLPDPFLIFTSQQDRALGLASFITGRKPRLGVIDGPEAVAGLDVQVIDFTAFGDGEAGNHLVATSSPSAISVLQGLRAQAEAGESAFQDYMVLTAQP